MNNIITNFVMGLCLLAQVLGAQGVAPVIYHSGSPILAMAAGDVDPGNEGAEVVCLAADGTVILLSQSEDVWSAEILTTPIAGMTPYQDRQTIEIGDVHSGRPGNEIVVEDGRSVLLYYKDPGTGWQSEYVFDATGLVGDGWGARVGDYDPRRTGLEILHIYEGVLDFSSAVIYREAEGVWEVETIYVGEVGMDSAAGDFDPDNPGPEIVITTEVGPTYEITLPQGTTKARRQICPTCWPRKTIWDHEPNSGWVIEIADITASPTPEIIYGTRYNNRIIFSQYLGPDVPHEILALYIGNADHTNPVQVMWDIAVGDMRPEIEEPEIAGVDDSGYVYLISRGNVRWYGQVLWKDTSPLYAVVAADVVPDQPGDELIVAGESGEVRIVKPDARAQWMIK